MLPPSRPAASNAPVAVPEKIFGLTLILDFFDRCHSLTSLHLSLAALGSLPTGLLHLIIRISVRSFINKKPHCGECGFSLFGDPPEIRTPDPLLKRQLLYLLS